MLYVTFCLAALARGCVVDPVDYRLHGIKERHVSGRVSMGLTAMTLTQA